MLISKKESLLVILCIVGRDETITVALYDEDTPALSISVLILCLKWLITRFLTRTILMMWFSRIGI